MIITIILFHTITALLPPLQMVICSQTPVFLRGTYRRCQTSAGFEVNYYKHLGYMVLDNVSRVNRFTASGFVWAARALAVVLRCCMFAGDFDQPVPVVLRCCMFVSLNQSGSYVQWRLGPIYIYIYMYIYIYICYVYVYIYIYIYIYRR